MSELISHPVSSGVSERIRAYDWSEIAVQCDARGYAVLSGLLTQAECLEVAAWFEDESRFRKHIVMQNHGYGRGDYKYFGYPLPAIVEELRTSLYPQLAVIANHWNETLRIEDRYPATHVDYLQRCHDAGQNRPTPLLLQYGAGDYNALHQDLYGDQVFPLQGTVLLSKPGDDFDGGEFVLTEQRPRMQSTVEVVPLSQGDCVVFAVNNRPVAGARSTYRVRMRHGVSRIRSGHRHTLGVIFHDAQ